MVARTRRAAIIIALGGALALLFASTAVQAAVPSEGPSLNLVEAVVDQVVRIFLNL